MPPTRNNREGPHVRRGKRRIIAVPAVVGGYELRSQLEARFAQELQRRAITWRYEPERISAAKYLVDFYLPDYRCWVEVKGHFDATEDLELPLVAAWLQRERGERLYLYMAREFYCIHPRRYERLDDEAWWTAILTPPEESTPPDANDRPQGRSPYPRRF